MQTTSQEYERKNERLPPIIGVASGGCFHVLDPRPYEVKVDDIAHHLAHIGRYTGACSWLWSVGAHCLEVSHRIEKRGGSKLDALHGLLHDASEAYLVDIPRPIKPDLTIAGDSYYEVERRVMAAIYESFNLPFTIPDVVAEVDNEMVYDEVANFFPPGFMWERYSINRKKTNLFEKLTSIPTCRVNYLGRYYYLRDRVGG